MPNIVWLGNHFFAEHLKRPGINLHLINPPAGTYIGWEQIIHEAGQPDIVVVGDKSLPPFVLGMENFPCLTVLYVVDSHIHSWFPYYAQAYDMCLVNLKDHIPRFLGEWIAPEQVIWNPPYAVRDCSPEEMAGHEKIWDIIFVGTMNPLVNPQRIEWLNRFKELEPGLHTASGDYMDFYKKSRLVLNHSIARDLNFRIFEVLGSGCPLLSPRLEHGLEELFTDGEDLFLFDQDDIAGAARIAGELLQNPELLLRAAINGHNKVAAKHMARHRAESFLSTAQDWLQSGKASALIKKRLDNAAFIRRNYLRFIYLLLAESMEELPQMQKGYLAAAAKSD